MSERMTPEEWARGAHFRMSLHSSEENAIQQLAEDHATAIREAVAAERERCAGIAEGDVDWTAFGKRDLGPWENGPDSVRDYRLGIVAGRAIAAAIRAEEAKP